MAATDNEAASMTIAPTASLSSDLGAPVSVRKSDRAWSLLGCAFFVLLAWWQISHHAMWRDELQAWEISVATRWPWDLFGVLHYEGHPGLWYLLLWTATFVTTDPHAMQVVQAIVAAGLVSCVWLLMPFLRIEKLLISCSYFLAFEYTVMSRSYGLGVLLTFLAMSRWQSSAVPGSGRRLLPWVLLGLAANTSLYGTLVAIVLAFWRFTSCPAVGPQGRRTQRVGLVLLAIMVAIALATMWPAADVMKAMPHGGNWSEQRFFDAAIQIVRTFVPLSFDFGPQFWEPIPFHPFWVYGPLTLPILWLVARAIGNVRPAIYTILAVAGGAAFVTLASYPASIRHTGMIFVVFLLMAWDARVHRRLDGRAFAVLLALNAAGGLIAIHGAAARPFSQAESVAAWFRANGLQQAFIAGTPEPVASAVAGYLRRPIYFPYCDCLGTYMVWRDPRREGTANQPLGSRLAEAMRERRLDRLYLITLKTGSTADPIEDAASVGLTVSPLASFDGANDSEENYDVFRVEAAPAPSRSTPSSLSSP